MGLLSKLFAWPSQLHKAGVMGMNARNYKIIAKNNKRSLYPLVDDKVITKELAEKHGINTPSLIGVIEYQYQVKNILEIIGKNKQFVIKPAQGSGGKGILVITDMEGDDFITPSGKKVKYKDIYKHISNVLSGLYSLGGKNDKAVIEELVHFSDVFSDFSYQGIPDSRIIVYKGYPVMAMMRLATSISGGRANLHQGAVGVGLDIATGAALNAVMRDQTIEKHPDTGALLKDIKVPMWKEHLIIAAKAYEMTGLGYIGADIVIDKNKGPMLLELNARPGLAIQIANGVGLERKLKNIDKYYPKRKNAEERVEYILKKLAK